jgi:sec-independent protein translocase protein TatC
MWRLDVRFTPAEAGPADLRGRLILAVDALRFSATAAAALASGARALYPFEDLPSLQAFAASRPPGSFLTAGEENAVPIPGLDLGNSPSAFTPERCRGRDVLAVTTNGTRLLRAAEGLGQTVLFSFVNLSAAADFASRAEGDAVIVCAGWRGRFAVEDALAAGALVDEALRRRPDLRVTEAASTARDLYLRAAGDIARRIRDTEAGARLASLGFADDIDLCTRRDAIPVLPVAGGSPLRLVALDAAPAPARVSEGAPREPSGAPPAPAPAAPPSPAPALGPGDLPASRLSPVAGPPPGPPSRPEPPTPPRGSGKPDPEPKRPAGFGLSKDQVDAFRMSIGEHLEELRRRVIWSLLFLLAAFLGIFAVSEPALNRVPVMGLVLRPVSNAFDAIAAERAELAAQGEAGAPSGVALERPRLIVMAPGEQLMVHLKICLILGVFVSSPLVFWQLWLFVAAGLYPSERKWVYVFAPATFLFFAAGVLFLYLVLLPYALRFLLGYGRFPDLMVTTGLESYVGFLLTFAISMGAVFEMPLVMVFLSRIGIVQPRTFAAKRRHVIVALMIVAAAVTPGTDPVLMLLVAGPLVVLYELGILGAKLVYRKREAGDRT